TKSVAILSKPAKPELSQILPGLLSWFEKRGYRVAIDQETANYVSGPEVVRREEVGSRKLDFVVVLGGDGTLLSASRAVAKSGIPVLGVNLASLGFLTEVPLAELYEALANVDQKRAGIESRSLVEACLMRGENCIVSYTALNDATVNKSAIARLNSYDLYID